MEILLQKAWGYFPHFENEALENPGPPGQEEHHLHRLGVVEKKQDGWDEGLLTHLIVWNPNLNLGGI